MQNQLQEMLKALKLGGMLDNLEVRNKEAIQRHLSYIDFLNLLVQDEQERRKQNKLAMRLRKASFDPTKTLESFDFSFNPAINKKEIFDLATCRFIEEKAHIWFLGPAGVGKSHLAQALATEACRKDIDALFIRVSKMLAYIKSGRSDGTYTARVRRFTKPQLLVLDEFALTPLAPPGPDDLYEVINERHEKNPIIITSNRAREEWPEMLGDPLLASAIIDRLAHNARQIEITGPSYRTKGKTKGSTKKKEK
jgi:DNA replication protein DnaC